MPALANSPSGESGLKPSDNEYIQSPIRPTVEGEAASHFPSGLCIDCRRQFYYSCVPDYP